MDISDHRFLVTGGAGFIGSNFCSMLIGKGAEVMAYDNLSSGSYAFVKHLAKNKRFVFAKADTLDAKKLKATFKNYEPSVVVHLAANPDVKKGTKDTKLDLQQGLMATYNVLEAARTGDVNEILFASSSVVYGIASVKPTPEDYGPLKPISLYGASKLASEGYITSFSSLYGFRYCIYRFANVVGTNLTHGIIVDFVRKLRNNGRVLKVLGNGEQKKSYIDVSDCINAMAYIFSKSREDENIYNISTDDQISAREIANRVVDSVSKGARIVYEGRKQGWPGDITNTYLSNKKMKAIGVKLRYSRSKDVVDRAIKTCTAINNY